MKPSALALTLLVLTSAAVAAPRVWKRYNGPWFRVYAPLGWKVTSKAKLPSPDSAIFTSPDGRACFTLYSPIWNGDPPEIHRDTKREILVSHRQQMSVDEMKNTIRQNWFTYRTTDGRWTRSVSDHENATLNTRLTFGFAYRDQQAFKRYQPLFVKFKKSVEQFSD
jgi:hypothetical protein